MQSKKDASDKKTPGTLYQQITVNRGGFAEWLAKEYSPDTPGSSQRKRFYDWLVAEQSDLSPTKVGLLYFSKISYTARTRTRIDKLTRNRKID